MNRRKFLVTAVASVFSNPVKMFAPSNFVVDAIQFDGTNDFLASAAGGWSTHYQYYFKAGEYMDFSKPEIRRRIRSMMKAGR